MKTDPSFGDVLTFLDYWRAMVPPTQTSTMDVALALVVREIEAFRQRERHGQEVDGESYRPYSERLRKGLK